MEENNERAKLVSFVNTTLCLKWELTKDEFDLIQDEFDEPMFSPTYTVKIGGEESEWRILMYPRGEMEIYGDKDMVVIYLVLDSEEKSYRTQFAVDVKTPSGYWPDHAKALFSRQQQSWTVENPPASQHSTKIWEFSTQFISDKRWARRALRVTTEEFSKLFIENKMTIVATLVMYMEGEGSQKSQSQSHMEVVDDFIDDIRSLSAIDNLQDFTVMCQGKKFPCNKLILSARSKFFRGIFVFDENKTETTIDDSSPEMVEAILNFISDGLIPGNIDDIAMELIPVADRYGPESLTKVCAESLMTNLSPDNAVETLILIDRHQYKLRPKVFDFIKKSRAEVVNSRDWDKLVQNFPALVKDMFLAM